MEFYVWWQTICSFGHTDDHWTRLGSGANTFPSPSKLVCTNSWHHLETFQQNDTGVSGPVNSVRVQIHLPRRTDRISGLTAGKAPTARGCKGTKRIYVCYHLVGLRWIFKTVSLRIKGPRGISSSKRTFLLFP